MPSSYAQQADDALTFLEAQPAIFANKVLGHDLWSTDIHDAIAKPHARVAVKACHASGKTYTASELVLWWVGTGGLCVTTAPTWIQISTVLWGEIHKAYRASRFPIGGELHQTELRLAPGCYAKGLSTNEGVRFQGFHGRVLVVLDEAPGVRGDIWEAIEGIRAGGDVRVLAIGNPTPAAGPFYDAFTADRSGWTTISIDAFDTPNLQGVSLEQLLQMNEEELDTNVRPYLVTRRWVHEKYHEWFKKRPHRWAARVRGQFPQQSEDALYLLSWLESAQQRKAKAYTGPVVAGVDVAGPGEDETVLYIIGDGAVRHMQSWQLDDCRGAVVAALGKWKDRLKQVNVDEVGIGYHVMTHLRDQGFPVRGFNAGSTPRNREKFKNAKAEVFWGLRRRLEDEDLAGLTDETTFAQLAAISYTENSRGQIVIESKDDIRKRGLDSPDRAEALVMACLPVLTAAGGVPGSKGRGTLRSVGDLAKRRGFAMGGRR